MMAPSSEKAGSTFLMAISFVTKVTYILALKRDGVSVFFANFAYIIIMI